MKKEFERLRKLCGTHTHAAKELGLSVRQYARIRASLKPLPLSTINLINRTIAILKFKNH